jgi:SAM-dependent methyltransferase
VPGARFYDWIYRIGAPWDTGPRGELVALIQDGTLDPKTHPKALDIGCGAGANTIHMAKAGFQTTGVDFSTKALKIAKRRAEAEGVDVTFVQADLTTPAPLAKDSHFDVLVDYGTLDDLKPEGRRRLAQHVKTWSRPGALLLFWCFYGRYEDLPRISLIGPSKLGPGLEPEEPQALFGDAFEIRRLDTPGHRGRWACFLMTRR